MALALLGARSTGAQPDPGRAPAWVRSGALEGPPELFPRSSPLFAPFKADPLEFRSGIKFIRTSLTSSANVATAVGVRPVIYEFNLNPGMRAQLLGCAVGLARFDDSKSEDLLAEDWRYGVLLATRYGQWSYALWLGHLSSHLGDEFIERTGATRINYAMEEVGLSVSFDATAHTRLYYGADKAIRQTHDDQPWRVQAGAEYFFEARSVTGGLGPYVALDAQSRQETGWKPSGTFILGFAWPGTVADRTLDLQLILASGATPLREFYTQGEAYGGLGFAVDL